MILCLGQIRAYKGVPDLVAAFGRLQSREARLVIAGKIVDSGFGDELRAMVSGNANIRLDEGFVEDERLQLYANAADVAVFPYHDILTSGAVVLAMSFGLPCVAPRLGCIGEYLDERGAFFFEPRSVTGLAEAIDRALARRAELPGMGRANLALASEWDWERIARETLEGYRR